MELTNCLDNDREPLSASFWDVRPDGEWAGEGRRHYRDVIYPMVFSWLRFHDGHLTGHGLELCGGNGEFAKDLLGQDFARDIRSYSLVDLNHVSIESAREHLADNHAVHIVEDSICNEAVYSDACARAGTKLDFVIGIGALTACVLGSKRDAITALGYAASSLRDGGMILLAGRAGSWIDSSDLMASGFRVEETYFGSRPFYVGIKDIYDLGIF